MRQVRRVDLQETIATARCTYIARARDIGSRMVLCTPPIKQIQPVRPQNLEKRPGAPSFFFVLWTSPPLPLRTLQGDHFSLMFSSHPVGGRSHITRQLRFDWRRGEVVPCRCDNVHQSQTLPEIPCPPNGTAYRKSGWGGQLLLLDMTLSRSVAGAAERVPLAMQQLSSRFF